MKTILKLTATFTTFLLITFSTADAQRYSRRKSTFFIGIETTLATQSLKFSSDIAAIKPINSLQVGPAFGFVGGTKVLSGRLSYSTLTASDFGSLPTKVNQLDASVIFNPMQLMTRGQKYFEVYLTAGTYRGSIELAGTYVPTPKEEVHIEEAPVCSCPCCSANSSSGMLADPDMMAASDPNLKVASDPDVASSESSEKEFNEKLVTDYVNLGVGLQVRLQKKRYFANLFAEVKYGVPVYSKSNGEALANTNSNNQMGVSFGIRFGLSN